MTWPIFESSAVVFPVDKPTVEKADVCSNSKYIGFMLESVIKRQIQPIKITIKANNKIENDLYKRLEEILRLNISTFFLPLIVEVNE